jgi:hypothetical protein
MRKFILQVMWVPSWSSINFIVHHTRIKNCHLGTRYLRQQSCTLPSNICGSPVWSFFMLPFWCLALLGPPRFLENLCILASYKYMKLKIYFNKFLKISTHVGYLCLLRNLLNYMWPSYKTEITMNQYEVYIKCLKLFMKHDLYSLLSVS